MPEVAVNVPFESNEIVEIAVEEFRKRLKQLGPIQGAKEYAKFMLDFQVKIKLWRTGDTGLAKETLAWGHHEGNPQAIVEDWMPRMQIFDPTSSRKTPTKREFRARCHSQSKRETAEAM